MEFRIGLNLGEVILEGERIDGDGVNIAAHLEGLAEAGGICISGIVYDQVETKILKPMTISCAGWNTMLSARRKQTPRRGRCLNALLPLIHSLRRPMHS
jgi:class 3 adenylate cyclase